MGYHMPHKTSLWLMMACVSMAGLTGCSSSGAMFRDPAGLVRDPGMLIGRPRVEKQVVRLVALWESSNGKGIDEKPSRGFAGQILFFGPKTETGSRVRGHVNIYQYDNFDPDTEEDLKPLHTFSFDPDAWDLHHTEGTLGHSYSCFIPYMRKHRDQVNVGLKVEFVSEDGQSVASEITEVLLGSRSATNHAAGITRGFVREAQLGAKPLSDRPKQTFPAADNSPTLDSLTIPLPNKG